MTIPDFQTLMLPVVRRLAERQHSTDELVEALSEEFGLDAAERAALLPKGRQRVMANRVHWALSYLNRAGLIIRLSRGVYEASPAGREMLAAPPERITTGYLRSLGPGTAETGDGPPTVTSATAAIAGGDAADFEVEDDPRERLTAALADVEAGLAEDLVVHLRQATPSFFERVVLDVLRAMGYGGSTNADEPRHVHLGRTGDGGVDGVIMEDALGLDVVHLQAKQYAERPVGVPTVREFAGALDDAGGRKGVIIALSTFTSEARAYASRLQSKRIVLIDGTRLVGLMIRYGVGVRTERTIEIRRTDADYFNPENPS